MSEQNTDDDLRVKLVEVGELSKQGNERLRSFFDFRVFSVTALRTPFCHAGMHRFAELVEPGAPGEIPLSAPVGLFFKAHDIGNICACAGCRFESSQLRHT